MNECVTVITSNLSYKQAIFSLLALEALSNVCVGNQLYRDTVQNIIHQTINSSEMEWTIIESFPEIETQSALDQVFLYP